MVNDSDTKKNIVLIIEDDEFLRKVIAQKLEKEGFDVQTAIDAPEALDLMKKQKPDIILLDLILPGVDGFGLLDGFKKDPVYADIPVIVLSNLGEEEGRERAIDAGADDYLVKADYTPDEIVEKTRGVLSKKYL